MNTQTRDIRGLMIQVTNGRVLLPNATVSEVITYTDPEPVEDAPKWLLGRLRWRGWRLPVVSFSQLAGWAPKEGSVNAKVAVLKALGGNPRLPYMAILSQGFPRLTAVSPELLIPGADASGTPGVRMNVIVRDDEVAIPDLQAVEDMVAEALALHTQA